MTKPNDDLEAVRIIADALKDFEKNDQERIIRWARERVGLDLSTSTAPSAIHPASVIVPSSSNKVSSIKEFIDSKNPVKDIHFAAAVAFYYRFEIAEGSKKEAISSDDLQEACRLTNRTRFKKPIGVLNNAENLGLLDRQERGLFKINAVGENLVAMGLPANTSNSIGNNRRPVKRARKNNKVK